MNDVRQTEKQSRPDATVGPVVPASRLGRREFFVLGTGAFVLLSLPRAIRGRSRQLVRRVTPMMGSFLEIAIPADDRRFAHAAIDAAVEEVRRLEALLTRFRSDSDVGRANRAAPGTAVAVSSETAGLLEEALHWAEASGGAFDPCLERMIRLWDVGYRRAPPSAETSRRFAGRAMYRQLEIDRGTAGAGAAVRLHHPDAGIDLGGIGKGFGVDRAVEILRRHGVRDALVNLGGDLYALGRSDDGDRWAIGVRGIADPSRPVATFEISDRAVATSGDYVQYFEHGGRRYHHLLDPVTGAPRRSTRRSVTVAATSCTAADAAATALYGRDPADARRRLESWDPRASLLHVI